MEPFIGEIKAVGFSFAPRGYARCAGQIMSIAQNTALFSLLGTQFGGNGQSTFGLPNLGGRVPVGQGQSPGTANYVMGEIAGTETTTLTQQQMPAHNHVATTQEATFSGTGTATGEIAIPAQSGGAATNTPGPTVFLGKPGAPTYAANSNTNLEPFSASLGATVSVTAPANGLGIQVGLAGSSQPFNILQPFQVINYVIAVEGVFPSRN